LLGDADRIVTWLSRDLDWEIPPPPKATHSDDPIKGSALDVFDKSDMARLSGQGEIVAPAKVEWLSGVGEMWAALLRFSDNFS
jgi:hypothetical protein